MIENANDDPPVEQPEALGRVVDLMFNMYAAPDRIRPLVDSMARLEPKSARAAIMKARLANYDGDSAAFERSIAEADAAIAPNDWKSRRDLALVVLTAALDDNPTSSRGSAGCPGCSPSTWAAPRRRSA